MPQMDYFFAALRKFQKLPCGYSYQGKLADLKPSAE